MFIIRYLSLFKKKVGGSQVLKLKNNFNIPPPLKSRRGDIKNRFKNFELLTIFSENYGKDILFTKGIPEKGNCPRCGGALSKTYYEDVEISKCENCGGIILKEKNLKKILIRKDYHFELKHEKEIFLKKIQKMRIKKRGFIMPKDVDPSPPLKCPYCKRDMVRMFLNYSIPVAVDYCPICKIYFFDKGELEFLQ